MSLALNPIQPVRIIDPVLDFKPDNVYGVLTGGKRTSFKPILSTSYNNTTATFSAPPPNPRIAVSRKIKLVQPVTFTISGTAPVGQNLLQTGYDAPRAYPLASTMSSLNVNLNNTTFSYQIADTIQALLRYHNPDELKDGDMSTTPTTMDKSQQYSDLAGSIRNPLAGVIDSPNGGLEGRGAFPIDRLNNTEILVNPTSTDENETITAIVRYTFCEDLFLSPMIFGSCCEDTGFIGLQTFQAIINWDSNLSRMWCHDDSGGSVIPIGGISVDLGQPALLFEYKSPSDFAQIPQYRNYGYYEVQRYLTEPGSTVPSGATGSTLISSSNIQLNSIPRIMYLYVRRRNGDRTFKTTDTFFSIEKCSINWSNESGLLSNASKRDLYDMSRRNGCNLSWRDWSGELSPFLSGSDNLTYNGVGSVLAVEFGTDIALPPDEAPGLNGTYQLQIDLQVKNLADEDILPVFVVVISNEGTFTIENNSAYSQIGVLSRQDILDAQTRDGYNYQSLKYMAGASFKSFGRRLRHALKKIIHHAPTIWKEGKKAVKTFAPIIKEIASSGAGLHNKKTTKKKKKKVIKSHSVY